MNLAHLFPLLVLSSVIGALVGCLVSLEITRRVLPKIIPTNQDLVVVDRLNLNCSIYARDGAPVMTGGYSITSQEISARVVERWLNERGLVMTPKGPDFTAKVTP